MFKVFYAILMGISVLRDMLSDEKVSRTELVFLEDCCSSINIDRLEKLVLKI